jgi:hypothetical protein
MEIASVVFQHNFDRDMLDQIDSLRMIRLNMAEKMLADLEGTCAQLSERGLIEGAMDSVPTHELREELVERVATLKSRLERPDVVYADEISLYADLLADTAAE